MSARKRYCICRSFDDKSFMVSCDKCEEWFHGKCVDITKKASKAIDKYYCGQCLRNNPNLTITYINDVEQAKPAKPKVTKINSPIKRKQTKSKGHSKRQQCANPECIFESQPNSKYCSPECGYAFNKLRYETHFLPKWKVLEENHSNARLEKMKMLDQLEKDKCDIEQTIKDLKSEKQELEHNIKIIKEEAKKQFIIESANSKENAVDDVEMENEESDEIISGDVSKTFCITCGMAFLSHQTFKHWSSCHKKHESTYNFTADVIFKHTVCKDDEDPKLYCHHQDKKTKRYCMNIESACPQHSDWNSDKDEVCACPLTIMQKLVPTAPYCLELKKDCTQHYHWDKFRLAQINMQRVHAYTRLDATEDRLNRVQKSLQDTYGGVVGVMLHNTLNHKSYKGTPENRSPCEQEDTNIDMTVD